MDRKQLFLPERRLGFTDDGLWQVRVSVLPESRVSGWSVLGSLLPSGNAELGCPRQDGEAAG